MRHRGSAIRRGAIAWLLVCAVLTQVDASAQAIRGPLAQQPIRRSIASMDLSRIALSRATAPAAQTSKGRQRSVGRRIAGGVIGGVGGFFAGGFLGARIEGDRCDCDDPGLIGFVIGAPIGAAAGAIVGAKFF